LEPLVEGIEGEKEGLRSANVDRHRQVEAAACFPNRIEPPIIHFDERPGGDAFAQIEAKCFRDLEAAGTGSLRSCNLVRLKLSVTRLIHAPPPGFREDEKPIRIRSLISPDRFLEPGPHTTPAVNHCADACASPAPQRPFRR